MELLNILRNQELHKLRKYRIYKHLLYDYLHNFTKFFYIWKLHRRGFTLGFWEICRLNKANYKEYLSPIEYNRIHPINGYYSKLIDDKLIIKYILNGTNLSSIMPKYYFLIDENSNVFPLMDIKESTEEFSIDILLNLLKDTKVLALKLLTGSLGKGFYKLEWKEENILINGILVNISDFNDFIKQLHNYAVTEYLYPHPYLAKFWDKTPNTVRYLVGRSGNEWRFLKGTIRFGSKESGNVENFAKGGILCYVTEKGSFEGGYMLDKNYKKHSYKKIAYHPDSNVLLKGDIPLWDKIESTVKKIESLIPMTKYLGFDFVVTHDNQIKLLEINSLSSLDGIQMDRPILTTQNGKWFFSQFK